jgi:hypothetical protein
LGEVEQKLGNRDRAATAYRGFLLRTLGSTDSSVRRERLQQALDRYRRVALLPRDADDIRDRIDAHPEPAQVMANAAAPSPSPEAAPVDRQPLVVARAAEPQAPKPRPTYKKWWVWTTVVGVAAAGAAIGLGVGLSQRPADPTAHTPLGTRAFP